MIRREALYRNVSNSRNSIVRNISEENYHFIHFINCPILPHVGGMMGSSYDRVGQDGIITPKHVNYITFCLTPNTLKCLI